MSSADKYIDAHTGNLRQGKQVAACLGGSRVHDLSFPFARQVGRRGMYVHAIDRSLSWYGVRLYSVVSLTFLSYPVINAGTTETTGVWSCCLLICLDE